MSCQYCGSDSCGSNGAGGGACGGRTLKARPAREHKQFTVSELLTRGGEWLGTARSWIQRVARNGSTVQWGSDTALEYTVRVSDIERLAAEVALVAMKPQPSETALASHLLSRQKAEQELAEAVERANCAARDCEILTRERDRLRALFVAYGRAVDEMHEYYNRSDTLSAGFSANLRAKDAMKAIISESTKWREWSTDHAEAAEDLQPLANDDNEHADDGEASAGKPWCAACQRQHVRPVDEAPAAVAGWVVRRRHRGATHYALGHEHHSNHAASCTDSLSGATVYQEPEVDVRRSRWMADYRDAIVDVLPVDAAGNVLEERVEAAENTLTVTGADLLSAQRKIIALTCRAEDAERSAKTWEELQAKSAATTNEVLLALDSERAEVKRLTQELDAAQKLLRVADFHRSGLADSLKRAERDRDTLRAQIQTVRTPTDGVWRWMGDGHDQPESLSCPVVMDPETLRDILGARDASLALARQCRDVALGERERIAGEMHAKGWRTLVTEVRLICAPTLPEVP